MPLVQGTASMGGEFPLEKLQAKLPNLTHVNFGSDEDEEYFACLCSLEYIAEFCGAFPRLVKLYLTPYELEPMRPCLINAISSLQHLRDLSITEATNDDDMHTIAQKLPNLEVLSLEPHDLWLHEIYQTPISSQTFRSIAQMPALRLLTVDIRNILRHANMITSADNFSMLKELRYYGIHYYVNWEARQEIPAFEADLKIANVRPGLKVRAK